MEKNVRIESRFTKMNSQIIIVLLIFAVSALILGYITSVVLSVGNLKMALIIFVFEFMNLMNRKQRIYGVQKTMNKQFKKFANEIVFVKSEEELQKILKLNSIDEVKDYVNRAHYLMSKKNIFNQKEARNFLKYVGWYGYFQSISNAAIVYSDPEKLNQFMNGMAKIKNRRKNVKKRVKTYNSGEKSKTNISKFVPDLPILFMGNKKRFIII